MITDYASLQAAIGDWLNRTDVSIPVFIQLAEANLRRDRRARKLQDLGTFVITEDGGELPSDFLSLESWAHAGPTYYGPIEITSMDGLADQKRALGPNGVPRFAALVEGGAYFAPAPSSSFSTRLVYWRKILPLSDENPTNWLLTDHPDIYLYGSLIESAPYLREDERIALWEDRYGKALNSLDIATQNAQFGGRIVRRPRRAIGG